MRAQDLSPMRPTAHLVNTARAGLDDESVLVEALRTGQDAIRKVLAAPAPVQVPAHPPPPEHSPLPRMLEKPCLLPARPTPCAP
ncbi:NAD(P)-dependent oxidoreductase [Streptomyces sp. NPDC101776]|uniref:NAD(P)-dependent oxidoreductase n=1 Tax=Streptomyces sp. NPDC101776 TaxID=3366146 RepID=UPI0038123103